MNQQSSNVIEFEERKNVADLKNGFTQIANEILEKICCVDLTARQYRVLISIARKTYGYNKKTDWISASQIANLMSYEGDVTHIRSDVRELKKRKILLEDGKQIGINKDLSKWELEKKNRPKTVYKQTENGLPQTDRNRSLSRPKSVSPQTENGLKTDRNQSLQKKYNTTKDNITKNTTAREEHAECDLFDVFWNAYDKQVGRKASREKWAKLSLTDKQKIIQHVPRYVSANPVKKYRKNPATYLNQEAWNDEIIENSARPEHLFGQNIDLDDNSWIYDNDDPFNPDGAGCQGADEVIPPVVRVVPECGEVNEQPRLVERSEAGMAGSDAGTEREY